MDNKQLLSKWPFQYYQELKKRSPVCYYFVDKHRFISEEESKKYMEKPYRRNEKFLIVGTASLINTIFSCLQKHQPIKIPEKVIPLLNNPPQDDLFIPSKNSRKFSPLSQLSQLESSQTQSSSNNSKLPQLTFINKKFSSINELAEFSNDITETVDNSSPNHLISQLKSQISTNENTITQLKSQLLQLQSKTMIDDLNSETMIDNKSTNITSINEETQSLKQHLADLETNNNLKIEIDTLRDAKIKLESKLKTETEDINKKQLQIKLDKEIIETLKKENENNIKLVAKQENIILDLNHRLDENISLINKQENTIIQLNNQLTENNILITKRDEVITELNNKLNGQDNIIIESNNKLKDQDNIITELNNKLKDQANIITELNNKLKDQANIIIELNDKLKDQDTIIMKLKTQNGTETLNNKENDKLIIELNQQLEENKDLIVKQHEIITQLKSTDNNNKETISHMKSRLSTLESKLEEKLENNFNIKSSAKHIIVIFINSNIVEYFLIPLQGLQRKILYKLIQCQSDPTSNKFIIEALYPPTDSVSEWNGVFYKYKISQEELCQYDNVQVMIVKN